MENFGVWISPDMINFTDNGNEDEFIFRNFSEVYFDILYNNSALKATVITLYAIVILVGFIGNSILFGVIFKNKILHKATNIFIASLAFSDGVICIISLPLQLHYQLTDNWPYGEVMCHVFSSFFGVPIFMSAFSTTMVAVDRYLLIVHPHRKRMTKRVALVTLVILVIISGGLASPVSANTQYHLVNIPTVSRRYCTEVWRRDSAMLYSVLLFFVQFVFPAAAMIILYLNVSKALLRKKVHRARKSSIAWRRVRHRNQRTNRMVIFIVLCFVVQWLPWNIYNLVITFNHQVVYGESFKLIDMLLKLFAMTSACVNPILNGFMNENFRKMFQKMVTRKDSEFSSSTLLRRGTKRSMLKRHTRSQRSFKQTGCPADDKSLTDDKQRSTRRKRYRSEGDYDIKGVAMATFAIGHADNDSSKMADISEREAIHVKLSVQIERPLRHRIDAENITDQIENDIAVIDDEEENGVFVENAQITTNEIQTFRSLRKCSSVPEFERLKGEESIERKTRSRTNEGLRAVCVKVEVK